MSYSDYQLDSSQLWPSDPFSASTKFRAAELLDSVCWACDSYPPKICHAIAEDDSQYELWEEHGLVTSPLRAIANTILLCPSCHAQLDDVIDPGFVFIPTDLQFFIDFEMCDRERRKETTPPMRMVPSADPYKQHQVTEGIISKDAIGGLYLPIFLKSYLDNGNPPPPPPGVLQMFERPKEWHGEPMASIRRAIAVLGSARRNLTQEPGHIEQSKKRWFDDTESKATEPEEKPRGEHISTTWALGPEVTTEEVVRRFAPLVSTVISL